MVGLRFRRGVFVFVMGFVFVGGLRFRNASSFSLGVLGHRFRGLRFRNYQIIVKADREKAIA